MNIFTAIFLLLGTAACAHAYILRPSPMCAVHRPQPKKTKLLAFSDVATSYLSVAADYAAEVQDTVGEEVYIPIFRGGLFLTLSGFAACFVAAFLITRSNAWDLLDEEFNTGREEIIEREMAESDVGTKFEKKTVEVRESAALAVDAAVQQIDDTADDDLDDLDI